MVWKNRLQLENEYKDIAFKDAFAELYGLRILFLTGILKQGYSPPNIMGDYIKLNKNGGKWLSRLQQKYENYNNNILKYVIFLNFYYHDLYVDVFETDADKIRKIISNEILKERIKYPWIYERLLYDRFFDNFPNQTENLTYDETMELLSNTPCGVFQIRDLLAGPFGIIKTDSFRSLIPTKYIHLWHCSDPSCNAEHKVKLSGGETKFQEIFDYMYEEDKKEYKKAWEWGSYFSGLITKEDHYDDVALRDLTWLIGDGFNPDEIKAILKRLLKNHYKEIKHKLPETKYIKRVFSGNPIDIPGKLDRSEIFQSILCFEDQKIVIALEELIEDGEILIPATEKRKRIHNIKTGGWVRVRSECSRYGIRNSDSSGILSIKRLKRLITSLYNDDPGIEELSWKLRHEEGNSVFEKLDNFINSEDIRKACNELIFTSPSKLLKTFDLLKYGKLELPKSVQEESTLLEKILWKLGFDTKIYPEREVVPVCWTAWRLC